MVKRGQVERRRTTGTAPPPDPIDRDLGSEILKLFANRDRWRGVREILRATMVAGGKWASVRAALQALFSRGYLQFNPRSRKYRLPTLGTKSRRKAPSSEERSPDQDEHFVWPSAPGSTLSEKTAIKEYGLTRDEIAEAARHGKLHWVINYAHGNPYNKLVRKEIEKLVSDTRPDNDLKTSKLKSELARVTTELRSLRRKTVVAQRRKAALEAKLGR